MLKVSVKLHPFTINNLNTSKLDNFLAKNIQTKSKENAYVLLWGRVILDRHLPLAQCAVSFHSARYCPWGHTLEENTGGTELLS